jgi:EAL and modified HD-GYP domain-containing signal transduction protein
VSTQVKKFVARQPILNREQRVVGYELFFRSGLENYFSCDDPDRATSSVLIDSFLLFGLKTLTGGNKAYINFTQNLLAQRYATLLPKEQVVVEIVESVRPEPEILSTCEEMKAVGYLVALDDFVPGDGREPLVPFADIIKVDFQALPVEVRKSLIKTYSNRERRMLAEKVETREEFREAVKLGYDYFQGYFFCKPEVVSGWDIPGYKLNYLCLLREVHKEDPDFAEVERIVKLESSLCYKLLRFLNSVAFYFKQEISSIRHALLLLGVNELRKWVSLVALAGLGSDKPEILVVNSIVRARFCENLAPVLGLKNKALDLFLLGLLSLMDAILERPMSEILNEVPVSEDVKVALLQGSNTFSSIYDLMVAYERGEWQRAMQVAATLKVPEPAVAEAHLDAVSWGLDMFKLA